jgi:hypothetical protein
MVTKTNEWRMKQWWFLQLVRFSIFKGKIILKQFCTDQVIQLCGPFELQMYGGSLKCLKDEFVKLS